ACREVYRARLKAFFEPLRDRLCEDDRRRLDTIPLRILDCKVPQCAEVRRGAPEILDSLCDDCRAHFDEVMGHLRRMNVSFQVNPRLVRGLDYYTRTTFEVVSDRLGAQDAICGGGRYDGLVESVGGPATPGFGFAIGADRLVLALAGSEPAGLALDVYLVHRGGASLAEAVEAAAALRQRGLAARLDPDAKD